MNDRQQNIAGERDDLDTKDKLDALLDRALASYTPAHPRLGLEDRVRTQLNSAACPAANCDRIPTLWVWAAATALAALLLVVLTLRPHSRPVPANLAAAQGEPLAPTIQSPGRHPPIALARPSGKLPASLNQQPRLTPRQPSQQQLIAQLRANGSEVIASLARDDDKLDKPISIQPLSDDPLVIEPIKITPIDDNAAETGGAF